MGARSGHEFFAFNVAVQKSALFFFLTDWELGNTSLVWECHPLFVCLRVAMRRRRISQQLVRGRRPKSRVTLHVGHRNLTVLGENSGVQVVEIRAGSLFAQILSLAGETIFVSFLAQVNTVYFLFIRVVSRVCIWGHLLFLCHKNLVDICDSLIFTNLLAYFSRHLVRDTVWTIDGGSRHWLFRFFTIGKDRIHVRLLTWFFLSPRSLISVSLIGVCPGIR